MPRLLFGAADGEGIAIDLPERAQGRDGWDAPVEVRISGFVGTISAYFEIDDLVSFRKSLISLSQTSAASKRRQMPPKIRELVAELEGAGFVNRGGKGSHRNDVHPCLSKPITVSDNRR